MSTDTADISLALFLTLGSLVLILYYVMWHKGIMSALWRQRMAPAGESVVAAWTASALLTTAAVIAFSGLLISEDESLIIVRPYGTFLGCAACWPLTFLLGPRSLYPSFEPIALAAVAIASAWLCFASSQYAHNEFLKPLSVIIMVHHVFIDGMWWPIQ